MNAARRRRMEAATPEDQAKGLRKLYGAAARDVANRFAASARTPELARHWTRTAEILTPTLET